MVVLEHDLGRLIKAHSDQRELWGYTEKNIEPDLGRFNNTEQHKKGVVVSVYGVNRPKSGSHVFFFFTHSSRWSLWALISRPKIGL